MARNEDDSSTSLICTFAAKMHCTTYRMEHQSCYRSIVFRADLILLCFTNKYHLDHFNFGFESGFDSGFDSAFDSIFDSEFDYRSNGELDAGSESGLTPDLTQNLIWDMFLDLEMLEEQFQIR